MGRKNGGEWRVADLCVFLQQSILELLLLGHSHAGRVAIKGGELVGCDLLRAAAAPRPRVQRRWQPRRHSCGAVTDSQVARRRGCGRACGERV